MYADQDFKTKKAFREAVEAGKVVQLFQPNNFFNVKPPEEGTCAVEGPHYPAPHSWYATVTLADGKVVKVK